MAMMSRPVDPRLCQKLQCGVVSPAELTPDVLADCYAQGYVGTKSPMSDGCQQYYPAHCQVGPARAFPDASDAWPARGPSVADVAALWPAMPGQAVGMPAPFDYGSADSGGVPMDVSMTGRILSDGSTVYVPDQQSARLAGPSNIFMLPTVPGSASVFGNAGTGLRVQAGSLAVPGGAGYPYIPGATYPADQVMQPTTDTGLDQMAGPTGPLKWPWSVTADYNTPVAPTPDLARYTTLPAGPSTFLKPLPSITPQHGRVSGMDAALIEDNAGPVCQFSRWVENNKLLAVGGLAVIYLALTGGGRGR